MEYKIKRKILSYIPESVSISVRSTIRKYRIQKLYRRDVKRHNENAYFLKKNYTKNNLKAAIALSYHSIEKGLSQPNVRLGFGQSAFKRLFRAMDNYLEYGYPTEDSRFQQGISVVVEYVKYHEANNYYTDWVSQKLVKYLPYFNSNYEGVGGYGVISQDELPDYSSLSFKELALSRHSIRDFGEELIDDGKVNEAIQIATKTPSACNRQPYRVYKINNKDILEKTIRLQGGLTTHSKNLQSMILVTCNREFMNDKERNQTFIDGGMFAMSLVYALTYNQIATCTLNTTFSNGKEKEARKLLGISDSEDLIAFIAMGSFRDENKYAKSPRDDYKEITIEI